MRTETGQLSGQAAPTAVGQRPPIRATRRTVGSGLGKMSPALRDAHARLHNMLEFAEEQGSLGHLVLMIEKLEHFGRWYVRP
jgi:hypothetical protein